MIDLDLLNHITIIRPYRPTFLCRIVTIIACHMLLAEELFDLTESIHVFDRVQYNLELVHLKLSGVVRYLY